MKNSTNNLQQLMNKAGIKMPALHLATGVPTSSIGAFKNGDRPIKPEHRKALEDFFGEKIVEIPQQQQTHDQEVNVVGEAQSSYVVRRMIWIEADNKRLEALLIEYAGEKDWGAVKEITTELLNRKITDKLKGKLP